MFYDLGDGLFSPKMSCGGYCGSPLFTSWTGSQGAAGVLEGVQSGHLRILFLLCADEVFSADIRPWPAFAGAVCSLVCSLRPRFPAGKWWTVPSVLGVSCCTKWSCSSMSGSCLWGRTKMKYGLVPWGKMVPEQACKVFDFTVDLCSSLHLLHIFLGSDWKNHRHKWPK